MSGLDADLRTPHCPVIKPRLDNIYKTYYLMSRAYFGDLHTVNYAYKTEPFDHQRDALETSADKRDYAYFMEMGCGKSKVLIDNAAYLYEAGRISSLVIVAPKGVYRNWVLKEIPIHMPDRIPHQVGTWRSALTKKQKAELSDLVSYHEGLRVLVVNIEAFVSKKCVQFVENFMEGERVMFVVDESTTIKNHKAKRTKVVTKLANRCAYRRILTGSPVTQSPMDLYSQCAFLDPDLLGCDNYYQFQARYAIMKRISMGAHSFNKVVGYRNMEELSKMLKPFSSRVLKKDCLDLPDKTYTVRHVSLDPEQAQHYHSMQKAALVILEDETIFAQEAMTQLLRLQQILCGYLPIDDEGTLVDIPTRRLDALMDTIEETSGKIIIWARFRKDIQRIEEALAKKYGFHSVGSYYGDTNEDAREELVRNFSDPDHETRFFVGNPQTAGYGLTLVSANTVIYYSNDFNLETRAQSEDRCHRIGQKHPVTYIDLLAEGTVDEHIVRALQNKIRLAGAALGEEMREWLKVT